MDHLDIVKRLCDNHCDKFVVCPICKNKFKEINTSHLLSHNLDVKSFDKLYPGYERLSKISRIKKATLKNLTQEMSKNLKFGHTLEGFKKKYGDILGIKKYKEMQFRHKKSKTIEFYIKKYGEKEGIKFFNDMNKRKAINLNNFIKLYGKEEGNKKYYDWKNSTKLEIYIKKHGLDKGMKKWIQKNQKISRKNRKIPLERISEFKIYKELVNKITNLSLNLFELKNIDLRGLKNQLDHKVSIYYGFIHNIEPYIIGSIYNLRIVSANINCSKQELCSFSVTKLIKLVENNELYLKIKENYKKWKRHTYYQK